MMTTTFLALVPRDGFFCKDGRGWHTSASGRGHGLDWPWPSTVLGALRSAWGRGEEARTGTFFAAEDWRQRTQAIRLGRTLTLRRAHARPWRFEDTVWPVPADALWLEGHNHVYRLDPGPPDVPTLGRDDDDAREALWRPRLAAAGKPLASPRWWSSEDFTAWLAGRSVVIRDRRGQPTLARRVQVRVGIRPEERTANEGVLFSHDVVETLEPNAEWAIGAEITLPDGPLPGMATLGSDARLARAESLPPALFDAPAGLIEAFRSPSKGLRVVAVTPLSFSRGWLPDDFEEKNGTFCGRLHGLDHDVVLRAAFVPRPIHVSGWDMAAGAPKPTSRMVAPGAVYFFERTDGEPFNEADARSLWLGSLGTRTDEGFGRVVTGVWRSVRTIP